MSQIQKGPGGQTAAFVVVDAYVAYLTQAAVTVGKDQRNGIVLADLADLIVKQSQKNRSFRAPGAQAEGDV